MEKFFELVKFKDCEDICFGFSANNVYLGCNGETVLDAKPGYNEVFSILQELNTKEFNTSPLFHKIGELCILSCLYQERKFFENLPSGCLRDRESLACKIANRIKEVLVYVPDIDVNDLLDKSRLENIHELSWVDGEFVSDDYSNFRTKLEHQLNQSEFCVSDCEDVCLLVHAGDIFENIEADDYNEDYYFYHKSTCSETYDYIDLVPQKVQLMNKIVDEEVKLSFINEGTKSSVLDDLIEDLVYCSARVNFSSDIDDEFFMNLKSFMRVIALAPARL